MVASVVVVVVVMADVVVVKLAPYNMLATALREPHDMSEE